MLINANKLSELHFLLNSNSYDLLFFTETWFNANLTDSVILNGSNYDIIRHDRPYGIGGGCCVFIKEIVVNYIRVQIPDKFSDLDIICFDLHGSEIKYRFINFFARLIMMKILEIKRNYPLNVLKNFLMMWMHLLFW